MYALFEQIEELAFVLLVQRQRHGPPRRPLVRWAQRQEQWDNPPHRGTRGQISTGQPLASIEPPRPPITVYRSMFSHSRTRKYLI